MVQLHPLSKNAHVSALLLVALLLVLKLCGQIVGSLTCLSQSADLGTKLGASLALLQ